MIFMICFAKIYQYRISPVNQPVTKWHFFLPAFYLPCPALSYSIQTSTEYKWLMKINYKTAWVFWMHTKGCVQ